jgi:Arc/MetJ family transcription regulator
MAEGTMARTTLDIDKELIEEAMSISEASTKKGVIEEALRAFVRARRIESLRSRLGKFELGLTHEELRRMREDE